MLFVVETFSGIGSQAKALARTNIPHKILATCDWDINAVIAYDLIHNGQQNIGELENMNDEELNGLIIPLQISNTGKAPMSESAKKRLPREVKLRLLSAIRRTNNLLDITSIHGIDIPNPTNLLTYSFPCQDLSVAGYWKGNEGGIEKNAHNRSSLLWQIERLLKERNEEGLNLPRFLVMENVTNILSSTHIENFRLWQQTLVDLGYINIVMSLDARNFGMPQKRIRTIMISINCEHDPNLVRAIRQEFGAINENNINEYFPHLTQYTVQELLRLDYDNPEYLEEAHQSNPNNTVSRQEIRNKNSFIGENTESVPTITTKQDRHPNSGLIEFTQHLPGRTDYRYLTPRECFMLMGFDEDDYQVLMNNNFEVRNHMFFTRDKLNRMAGNSICVNVLESVFQFINEINEFIDDYY